MTPSRLFQVALRFLALAAWASGAAWSAAAEQSSPETTGEKAAKTPAGKGGSGLTRLTRDYDVWMDVKRKTVVVGGRVCLREGQLEMFACPRHTKEHESIVSVNIKARYVHAALLAVGARKGQPVRFDPQYVPASGGIIDVTVAWKDKDGKQRSARAQDWIRNVKTGKSMEESWVFAGSGFWKEPQTGKEYYYAEAGDLICVSNFPSATLDLPIKSSQDNSELMFEAYTERIPPLGTEVRLILKPRTENPRQQPKQ